VGGIPLYTVREKKTVMCYLSLFEASGILLSNMGLQITHDMYLTGYFMLLFDPKTDRGAPEGHTSHRESGNIRRSEIQEAIILNAHMSIVSGTRQLRSH
jgi:hypothetical protein